MSAYDDKIESAAITSPALTVWEIVLTLFELSKFRMIVMIWVTVGFGYFLAAGFTLLNPMTLILTLLGSGLAAVGSFYHNQYLEVNVDSLMPRTMRRPLPTGKFAPWVVLWLGVVFEVFGLGLLYYFVNPMTAFLTGIVAASYVLIYTPLKQISWVNTTIGAIPGAIPPMIGWAAVRSDMGLVPWILFAVMFLWQHPHFYAIGWLYRHDYQLGGIKVLPALEQTGVWSGLQAVFFAALLIPLSLTLYWTGVVGVIFFYGAIVIGTGYFIQSFWFALYRTKTTARYLLFGSLIYLPAFLLLLSLDSKVS